MGTIETVLCPVDFSALSERCVRLSVEICRRTGAKLVLEHNVESHPPTTLGVGWMWSEEHRSQSPDKSELAIQRIEELFKSIPDGIDYEAKLTHGAIHETLLHLARTLPAGLMVMGTHGRSNSDHQSLTEKIIIRAPCTVLTIGESYHPERVFGAGKDAPEDLCMLVPYDFSARARACLDSALAMAHRMPHRIHLLHVVQPKLYLANESDLYLASESDVSLDLRSPRKALEALIPDEFQSRMSVDIVVGDPARQIVNVAHDIGALFILMPAHGKNPLKRFLFGSTTLTVLHSSHCPVWFMSRAARRRPPEWAAA